MAYKDLIVVAMENDQNRINIGHIWLLLNFRVLSNWSIELLILDIESLPHQLSEEKGAMSKQHRLLMKNLFK